MRHVLLALILAATAICPAVRAQQLVAGPPADSLLQAPPQKPVSWLKQSGRWRLAIPVTLIGLGYFSRNENVLDVLKREMHEETRETFPRFYTRLDDYTRHAPVVAAYGLYAAGMKGKVGVVPFSICYGLSHALSSGIVSNLKRISHTPRPDNPADFSSFPSAHTAEAFMTATLLHEQFGRQHPWVSIGGYTLATATGAMRLLNNRHWITDVLAGASIGVLSTEAVWHLYPVAARLLPRRLGQKLLLLPTYAPGGTVGMTVVMR